MFNMIFLIFTILTHISSNSICITFISKGNTKILFRSFSEYVKLQKISKKPPNTFYCVFKKLIFAELLFSNLFTCVFVERKMHGNFSELTLNALISNLCI